MQSVRVSGGGGKSEFCTILVINLLVPVHVEYVPRNLYNCVYYDAVCSYIYIYTHLSSPVWCDKCLLHLNLAQFIFPVIWNGKSLFAFSLFVIGCLVTYLQVPLPSPRPAFNKLFVHKILCRCLQFATFFPFLWIACTCGPKSQYFVSFCF
jgi:hypothetical protein